MRTVVADPDTRRRELAAIHIAKKDLAMDDGTYRDMLFAVARVRSAGDLDQGGRTAVIEHLRKSGFARRQRPSPAVERAKKPAVAADCQPLVDKIEAQLTSLALPWRYAEAMAERMFNVKRLEWCKPEQLRKDRKSTRLNSSHIQKSRMPSSA